MPNLNTFNSSASTVFVLTLVYALLISFRFAANTIINELNRIRKSYTIPYIELLSLIVITMLIFAKEIKKTLFIENFKDFKIIVEDVAMSDINHQIIDIKDAKPPEDASKCGKQSYRNAIDISAPIPIKKTIIRSSKRLIYTSHKPMKIQKLFVHNSRSLSQFKTIHTDQVQYHSFDRIEKTKLVIDDGSKRRTQFKLNLIESKETIKSDSAIIFELQTQNLEYNYELTMHQHLQNILNLISSS